MRLAVVVDEGNHGLNRRSSSAWARHALALRRVSLACRSSRFSVEPSALVRYIRGNTGAHTTVALGLSSPTRPASAPCSRSWRRSTRPPPSARHARLRDPKPFAPRRRGPRKRTCWSSCLSWPHLLQGLEPPINPERFTRTPSGCFPLGLSMSASVRLRLASGPRQVFVSGSSDFPQSASPKRT